MYVILMRLDGINEELFVYLCRWWYVKKKKTRWIRNFLSHFRYVCVCMTSVCELLIKTY
jgi:hypothetical protein